MVLISEIQQFPIFRKRSKEIVVPFAPVSKVLEFLGEWKAPTDSHLCGQHGWGQYQRIYIENVKFSIKQGIYRSSQRIYILGTRTKNLLALGTHKWILRTIPSIAAFSWLTATVLEEKFPSRVISVRLIVSLTMESNELKLYLTHAPRHETIPLTNVRNQQQQFDDRKNSYTKQGEPKS